MRRTAARTILALSALIALAACDSLRGEAKYDTPLRRGDVDPNNSIFGPGGLTLFGSNQQNQSTDPGIGVNSFLWRASLDTVAFMPLASADPFGGVIITDWYTPPQTPNERFKVTVYILDRALRADGVKVAVFKQAQTASGWADQPVGQETVTNMENAILTRARQLRVAAGG